MSLREGNGPEGGNGEGAGGAAGQGDTSEAGSRDFDEGSVSSTSSFEGTDLSRVRAALGEVGPGLENLDGRQHCSPMWFAMLEKGIKEKRITEDDAVAANAIIGFTRKVLDAQDDMRKFYNPEDVYDLFAKELETACRFIAWVQFRAELPLEAAKTAYATVVAKRDRRTYKATKSGVVFVFDEQAKVYESYYKAQLKNGNTKSSKPSDDEERALEGKTSIAAATKALAQQKRENERLRREKQGTAERLKAVSAAAREAGVALPEGKRKERATARQSRASGESGAAGK